VSSESRTVTGQAPPPPPPPTPAQVGALLFIPRAAAEPPATTAGAQPPPATLPKTGTVLPLLGWLGMLSLAASTVMRLLRQ
jgi:LPXTG-motif cell wall-anchored protein